MKINKRNTSTSNDSKLYSLKQKYDKLYAIQTRILSNPRASDDAREMIVEIAKDMKSTLDEVVKLIQEK